MEMLVVFKTKGAIDQFPDACILRKNVTSFTQILGTNENEEFVPLGAKLPSKILNYITSNGERKRCFVCVVSEDDVSKKIEFFDPDLNPVCSAYRGLSLIGGNRKDITIHNSVIQSLEIAEFLSKSLLFLTGWLELA